MKSRAARVENTRTEYIVKTKGEYETPEAFNDLVIAYRHGKLIKLRDIGKAEDGLEDERSITRFNGKTAVGLSVKRQSGENTVAVAERVKAAVAAIKPPQGMHLDITFDQSRFIRRSIEDVQMSLWLGAGLAVLIIFVFLRSVRSTLISAVALPISVIATFAFIQAFGFTLNIMTMLGLSLSIGILIDDAIVVLENIYRRMEEGEPPMQAVPGGLVRDRPGGHGDDPVHRGGIRARGVHEGHRGQVLLRVRHHRDRRRAHLAVRIADAHAHADVAFSELSAKSTARSICSLRRVSTRCIDVYRPLLALALRNRWKVILLALVSVVAGLAPFRHPRQGIPAHRRPGQVHGQARNAYRLLASRARTPS